MKALLATLALLVGFQAQATSVQMYVNHTLPIVKIDGKPSKLVGAVQVDFLKNEITLSLYQDPCGSMTAQPGTIHCMAMPVLKHQFTVPVQKRAIGACDSITYAGKIDQRPVDGALTAIEVVDNSRFSCPTYVAVTTAQVTVVQKFYNRMTGKEVTSKVQAFTNVAY